MYNHDLLNATHVCDCCKREDKINLYKVLHEASQFGFKPMIQINKNLSIIKNSFYLMYINTNDRIDFELTVSSKKETNKRYAFFQMPQVSHKQTCSKLNSLDSYLTEFKCVIDFIKFNDLVNNLQFIIDEKSKASTMYFLKGENIFNCRAQINAPATNDECELFVFLDINTNLIRIVCKCKINLFLNLIF